MSKKAKKNFWAKITRLDEEDLNRQGQEIEKRGKKITKKVTKKESFEERETWLPEASEGKLALDVYQKENQIIIQSALAGVKSKDLEIIIDKDILTIKGKRIREEEVEPKNYFHQECFWGHFSRTIILPAEVKVEETKANLKDGMLTINLPIKREGGERKKLKIK